MMGHFLTLERRGWAGLGKDHRWGGREAALAARVRIYLLPLLTDKYEKGYIRITQVVNFWKKKPNRS